MIALYVCIGNNQSIIRSDWQPQIWRIFEPEKSWRVSFEWGELVSSTQTSHLGDRPGRKKSKTKPLPPQILHSSSSEKPSTNKSLHTPESTPRLLSTCYIQAMEQVASIAINLSNSNSCYEQKETHLTCRSRNNILLVLLKIV